MGSGCETHSAGHLVRDIQNEPGHHPCPHDQPADAKHRVAASCGSGDAYMAPGGNASAASAFLVKAGVHGVQELRHAHLTILGSVAFVPPLWCGIQSGIAALVERMSWPCLVGQHRQALAMRAIGEAGGPSMLRRSGAPREVVLKQAQRVWGTTTAGETMLAGGTALLTQAGHGCGARASFSLMRPKGHTRMPGWSGWLAPWTRAGC